MVLLALGATGSSPASARICTSGITGGQAASGTKRVAPRASGTRDGFMWLCLAMAWAGLTACVAPRDVPAVTGVSEAADAPSDPPVHRALAPSEPAEPTRLMTQFVPSQHGFAFVNRFSGSPVPSTTLNMLWGGRMDYGLCGGMSFAAADYFLARRAIPEVDSPPVEGSALYRDLYRRQTQSLGIVYAGALRFAVWMGLSDRAVGDLTIGQLADIIASLDRGEPVVLGLVYHSFDQTLALWYNHQVLAYRVGERSSDRVVLRVYDPNYPDNDEVVISVWSADGSALVEGSGIRSARLVPGRRARSIRGIFAMPYRFQPLPSRAQAPFGAPASPAD